MPREKVHKDLFNQRDASFHPPSFPAVKRYNQKRGHLQMLKMEYRFKKKEKLLRKKLAERGIDYSFPSLVNISSVFLVVSLRRASCLTGCRWCLWWCRIRPSAPHTLMFGLVCACGSSGWLAARLESARDRQVVCCFNVCGTASYVLGLQACVMVPGPAALEESPRASSIHFDWTTFQAPVRFSPSPPI